jgi:Ca2+-transporting ATPase
MFVAPLLGLPIPLLPVQILWINLVTDGLPGLAMAAEPEEHNVMRRPPRHPSESIFAHGLGAHVVWVGALMAGLTLLTQFAAIRAGLPGWQTIVLCVMAFSQLAHALAIRSERESLFKQGLFSNTPLLGAVSLTVLLQLIILYVPAFNHLFGTQPLEWRHLGWTLLPALIVFAAVEAEKLVRRTRSVGL